MSKSIRFLGLAICFWAGVRAVSLGLIPGIGAMAFDLPSAQRRPKRLPPIEPSALSLPEPIQLPVGRAPQSTGYGGAYLPIPIYQPYPVYVAAPVASQKRGDTPQIIYIDRPPGAAHEFHVYGNALPALADAQPLTFAPAQSTPPLPPSFKTNGTAEVLDRLSLSSWALMRNRGGPDSLSNSGMLGGSEAGARLIWRFDPRLAGTFRTSAPINSQRGMEAAFGLRYQPFIEWPVALTIERRRGIKDYGRDAFALFGEGGLYDRPMPWRFTLDGYFQAGVVDFNDPDWFLDGQLAVTRPVWRNFSAGAGAWGGAQPGLRRVDVGPRMSVKVGNRMRAHLDYRLNIAGNAEPGSGPTVTLAGDF